MTFINILNESIIGMMMYTKAKISVVSSNTKGLSQHDLFSWQVARNRFVKVDSVANSSVKIDEIMKEWKYYLALIRVILIIIIT